MTVPKPFSQRLSNTFTKLEHLLAFVLIAITSVLMYAYLTARTNNAQLLQRIAELEGEQAQLVSELASVSAQLTTLKEEDQYARNEALAAELTNIQKTYRQAVETYEELVKLREQTQKTDTHDALFTQALTLLIRRDFSIAGETLNKLEASIAATREQLAASLVIPASVQEKNTPPDSGYSRQKVVVENLGEYLVDVVAADLNSTRVIVDTASEKDCANECPVLSVATYASRNNAFAAINGSYFCPASYPSCAGKTNSFDTLLMNKNKVYFNSENNVYSTVPAVIFSGNSARFVGQSLEWGRDTNVDAVLANPPLLVSGGNVVFGGDGDPKKGSKGNRSFIGASGSKVYMGVVRNATVAEVAHVLKTMGVQNALNLDSGGSTALWSGGYKVGPGRDVPNALLFVRK